MHYHCEIIFPAGTTDIEAEIKSVLSPFHENDEDAKYTFWDWYQIGGRFAGDKAISRFDEARVKEFYDWCSAEKITVSGLVWGKQTIEPKSQIPKVDAKWGEMFPAYLGEACPIFNHSNANSGPLVGDICPLVDAMKVICSRVIVALPKYVQGKDGNFCRTGPMVAEEMWSRDFWNGVSWQNTDWDGKLSSFVDRYNERHKTKLSDDSITVTVDYHN